MQMSKDILTYNDIWDHTTDEALRWSICLACVEHTAEIVVKINPILDALSFGQGVEITDTFIQSVSTSQFAQVVRCLHPQGHLCENSTHSYAHLYSFEPLITAIHCDDLYMYYEYSFKWALNRP